MTNYWIKNYIIFHYLECKQIFILIDKKIDIHNSSEEENYYFLL